MAQRMAESRNMPGFTGHDATVAASQTDAVVVAAHTGSKIRVYGLMVNSTDAAGPSLVTFNSKGGGAGTAISPQYMVNKGTWLLLPPVGPGWFETNKDEALTVTTAAGSAVSIQVVAEYL